MKVETYLKKLSTLADSSVWNCTNLDKFTEDELYEIGKAVTDLQNALGDVQRLFDSNGRKLEVWRG